MSIEHHGQRLSATLGMPKHTTFAVGNGGMLRGFDCFSDCKILMISSQNLKSIGAAYIKADKILDDVQQAFFLENAFKEGVKLSSLGIFIAAVLGFPLHETLFTGGNGSCTGSGHIAYHADCIIVKQRRYFVLIIPQLIVGMRELGLLVGWRFELHHYKGKSVQKENHIGAFFGIFNDCPLVCNDKAVVIRVYKIQQINKPKALLSSNKIGNRHAILQIVHKGDIFLEQRACFQIF